MIVKKFQKKEQRIMQIHNNWSEKDSKYIQEQLIAFNRTQTPLEAKSPFENICLTVKDEKEEIKGGLVATLYWECLNVHFLWVDDSVRHHGYGSKLLQKAEKIAKEKNCRLIKLDTFSFQAPEFYKKHGFKIYGVVEDFPKGCTQYYLEKRLTNITE